MPNDDVRDRDQEAIARRIVPLLDLTDLDDDHRADGIDRLLDDAERHGVAAVCVWPEFVARCAGRLDGSPVKVATVVDFPGGGSQLDTVVAEAEQALDDGADELDVVLAFRRVAAGQIDTARAVVEAVVEVARVRGALVKVICETGELAEPGPIRAAARLSIEAGADFVKTSTGKTATGATPEAVAIILDEIAASGRAVGVKASGGIRSVADAAAYLDLADERLGDDWATPSTFRFGASSLLGAALEAMERPR